MQQLTRREKEILKMLCLSNREIAKRLCISPFTVRTHVNHIFNKLIILNSNRQTLLIEAVKRNLIKIEEVITE